jgi:hypothetical protein
LFDTGSLSRSQAFPANQRLSINHCNCFSSDPKEALQTGFATADVLTRIPDHNPGKFVENVIVQDCDKDMLFDRLTLAQAVQIRSRFMHG